MLYEDVPLWDDFNRPLDSFDGIFFRSFTVAVRVSCVVLDCQVVLVYYFFGPGVDFFGIFKGPGSIFVWVASVIRNIHVAVDCEA